MALPVCRKMERLTLPFYILSLIVTHGRCCHAIRSLRVVDSRFDLAAVSDDAFVAEQAGESRVV
jgi:hypothetical protein